MHRRSVPILLSILVLLTAAALPAFAEGETDIEGGKDHPLLTRMPGYYLSSYEAKDFDSTESAYAPAPDERWEGKTTKLGYSAKDETKLTSMAQIARNYEAALRKIGGKVLYSDPGTVAVKIEKGGGKTYVLAQAYNDGRNYMLLVVETKAMAQDVVADAAALSQGIAAAGKVAVYGIFFDTNKAVVKPESAPTIDQILKMLKQSPSLKLTVVGHTDGMGVLETNLKLSADRAAAVVQALVGKGIDASRLRPAGVGPYGPEATNRTEDGRAKNRRVELVER
jgi:outer membrane protein OmpA-like peptidoglycan-associated protein